MLYRELAEAFADALENVSEVRHQRIVQRFVGAIGAQGGLAEPELLIAACEQVLHTRAHGEQLTARVAHDMTIPGAAVVVAPELIAGGTVSRGAVRADASVSGRLATLRHTLVR